jgi:hypothetical protein
VGIANHATAKAYSPNILEYKFCELRLLGILRSSHTRSSTKFGANFAAGDVIVYAAR